MPFDRPTSRTFADEPRPFSLARAAWRVFLGMAAFYAPIGLAAYFDLFGDDVDGQRRVWFTALYAAYYTSLGLFFAGRRLTLAWRLGALLRHPEGPAQVRQRGLRTSWVRARIVWLSATGLLIVAMVVAGWIVLDVARTLFG